MWLKCNHNCVNLNNCVNLHIKNSIGQYSIMADGINNKTLYLYQSTDEIKVREIYEKIITALLEKVEFMVLQELIDS